MCWLLWYIWKGQNEKVFSGEELDPILVIEHAKRSLTDYWGVCCPDTNYSGIKPPLLNKQTVSWVRPPENTLKVNIDGAFHEKNKLAAISVLCRDHWGVMKWAFVDKVKSLSAFMTEALALKRALMIVQDLGNKNVIFETDCLTLVRCLESHQPDLGDWQSRAILNDILGTLALESSFLVRFIPRLGNKAADMLAASTCKEVCPTRWVEMPLSSLLPILDEDAKSSRNQRSHTAMQPRCVDLG